MSVHRLPVDELLTRTARVIHNTRADPDRVRALTPFGYDAAALAAAATDVADLQVKVRAQQNAYGRQFIATEAVQRAWDALKRDYTDHVALARIAFKDRGVRRQLGLVGRRAGAFGAWLQEARRFYTTLQRDDALTMAIHRRGVTPEAVAAALTGLDELERLDREQERRKVAAQEATRARDEARKAVATWLADFQKVACIAQRVRPDAENDLGLAA